MDFKRKILHQMVLDAFIMGKYTLTIELLQLKPLHVVLKSWQKNCGQRNMVM